MQPLQPIQESESGGPAMSLTESTQIVFKLHIIIEPDGEEYHAYCPALKGLHTCGPTESEALSHAIDAADAYLRSLINHGEPIPLETVERRSAPRWPRFGRRPTHHSQQVSVAVA